MNLHILVGILIAYKIWIKVIKFWAPYVLFLPFFFFFPSNCGLTRFTIFETLDIKLSRRKWNGIFYLCIFVRSNLGQEIFRMFNQFNRVSWLRFSSIFDIPLLFFQSKYYFQFFGKRFNAYLRVFF